MPDRIRASIGDTFDIYDGHRLVMTLETGRNDPDTRSQPGGPGALAVRIDAPYRDDDRVAVITNPAAAS